jgi:methionyl-tRNA formyltransferase
MLRVVFMGTAPFAVPCLQAVAAAGHEILSVVSQPDRPHGRGMKLQPTPVKAAALDLGLPVLQPEKASQPEFIDQLRELAPQVLVVVAYGQILRPAVLEIPPLGAINVHGSLLPELRGAAPIQWSIIRGYTETGVTTMFMDAGMDTGDMILKTTTPIEPEDTAGALAERLAPLGANLLRETLELLESGAAPREPQDSASATYAPMLKREDGAIRWEESADEIRCRIHGCNPAPGAFARREGSVVKLWRARSVDSLGSERAGTIVSTAPLTIRTGRGALELLEVQPESRGRLSGEEFARGYRLQPGEVWSGGLPAGNEG